MLLNIDVSEKSFGDKVLYTNLQFDIQPNQKVGLIGRNGMGKSTLFHMITGDDVDFQGDIDIKKGIVVIASRQEHHGHEDKSVLDYIQGDLPEFHRLLHILETYPADMHTDERKMQRYSDALDRFSQLGYFEIEDQISQMFEEYQIDVSKMHAPLSSLSGGQKRMVELVKVQRARGDLALIDEPTNHMDYLAKQSFIKWLNAAQEAVMVITHDRDVLNAVDKIIEIRDGSAHTFRGNYEHYLQINKTKMTSQMNEHDLVQRRINNLRDDIIRFRRLKERANDPGTIKRFKGQEQRAETELEELLKVEKPSFWIDRDSADELTPKLQGAYEKYKAKNIRLDAKTKKTKSSRLLVQAHELSLGYGDTQLFEAVSFSLHEGERVRLHGRNGAGKTTLVNTLMAKINGETPEATIFGGTIASEKELSLGLYEQEIDEKYLRMKLSDAVELSLRDKDVPVNDQTVKRLLGEYLFTPNDGDVPISQLSGGQKARFQLIRMLIGDPLILILDEPTNHLDLPSIEELENALKRYHGAVMYISHDSYFARQVGGETIQVGS